MWRTWPAVVALLALPGLTGCEPDPGPVAASPPASPAPTAEPERGPGIAPVPAGMAVRALEFADAEHAYALFAHCPGVSCRWALAASADGGQSWVPRALPVDKAAELTLTVRDARTLTVGAGRDQYTSVDGGRTFRPGEAARTGWLVEAGRVRFAAADGSPPPAVAQPPLDGVDRLATGSDGRVWVAGHAGGQLAVAVSGDRGRSWQVTRLPRPDVAGRPRVERLLVAPDGAEAWAVLAPTPAPLAVQVAPAGGGWLRLGPGEGVVGTSQAPAGRGRLLSAAAAAPVVFSYQEAPHTAGPPDVVALSQLPDGTVRGHTAQPGVLHLCACRSEIRWTRVAVRAPVR
jgi:hypothetical protein